MKITLNEVKAMNKIAGIELTKEQEIAFIKNRLSELEFTNQASFDAYSKNHKVKPDTKVKIAGKETTAGDASKKPGMLQKLGAKLFGKKEEVPVPKIDPKHPLNKKGIYDPKRGSDVSIGKILQNPDKYKHMIPDVQAAIDMDPKGEKAAKDQAKDRQRAKDRLAKKKEYQKWREENPELAAKKDAEDAEGMEKIRAAAKAQNAKDAKSGSDNDSFLSKFNKTVKDRDAEYRKRMRDREADRELSNLAKSIFGNDDDKNDKGFGGGSFGGGGARGDW
jgi:hypothetical protein